MKRINRRAAAVLIPALLIALGMGFFLSRLALRGGDWAAYTANGHVYRWAELQCGRITDRNGELLLQIRDGEYTYAEDPSVRRASLHAVGDEEGYIAGTALDLFGKNLTGWNLWEGTDGSGGTVALSLDSRLQSTAWQALKGRSGAVVVLNYETGEILCMVSAPSYDPASGPEQGVDTVFLNRCIDGAFVPGSVFKLVTLIAARENIPDLEDRRFACQGSLDLGGDTLVCTGSHGTQTIETALTNSCNVAFGELAMELGGETLRATAQRLGLLDELMLDGYAAAAGEYDVPPAGTILEAWSGIGQYNDLATPYAFARLCAGIANGGTVREPTLRLKGKTDTTVLMSPEVAAYVDEVMNYTAYYGYRAFFPNLDLCAKTGTAEVGDGTDHAWIVGYLRSGAPLAFAVMIEHGGWGLYEAGPVANTVLQKALELSLS